MKVRDVITTLSAFPLPGTRFRSRRRRPEEEPPLRSVLFGLAQLQDHARRLAMEDQIDPKPGPERLLQRLKENERVIRDSYRVVAEAVRRSRRTNPAAEWLLDNAYLVEEQIGIAREHLPPGYSRELPRLASGPLKGVPRVYSLALEVVSHTDGRVEVENVSAFVHAYQTVQLLKLGELWAVPIMLRLALLENLRRVGHRIASRRRDQDGAEEWANRFLDVAHQDPKNLIIQLADFVRADLPMTQAFIAELATSLQGEHPALGLVINWLEQHLGERGQNIEQILQSEGQDQAADQVSVGNSITSLRTLAALDWQEFVESLSATEMELRRDPAGVYGQMDFRTRDRYRHMVEGLARRCDKAEPDVAAATVELARQRREQPGRDRRESHIGYFLVDQGRGELERAVGYHCPLLTCARRRLARHALAAYMLWLAALTAGLTWVMLLVARPVLQAGWGWMVLLGAGAALVASQPALSLLNWLATVLVGVRGVPRMDFSKGIPGEHRTVVVIPSLLTSPGAVNDLVENLEIRYLANRTPNLLFALLTDFPDAGQESLPGDPPLLDRACQGVRRLNQQYARGGQDLFFLLHRPRRWDPAEGSWMGYERKRGKLMAFTRLLCGADGAEFPVTVGDLSALRTARYVITLDTDTQLPRETAWKMVGAMAHPLNRPRANPTTGCVEAGYGVLQPRVAVSLSGAWRSPFARLFAGEVGVDPYTREVSNVYHDLFARGQFIGKGIFDAQAVHRALSGRFPENRILSHDLIEGCFARCGFLNDVELIEEHPSRYLGDVGRRHRWTRGDWQIAVWLLPRVPDSTGRRAGNPLDFLSRWLIFDNLRRSLVWPMLLALLLTGWLWRAIPAPAWTLVLLGAFALPVLAQWAWGMAVKPGKILWSAHLRRLFRQQTKHLTILMLRIAFLPFEAAVLLDAVWRVAWRTMVTHRRMLEWQTATEGDRRAANRLLPTVARMWPCLLAVPAAGAATALLRPDGLPSAAGLLALWTLAPLLAWSISRPYRPRRFRLNEQEVAFLRRVARRTWAFFDQFASERDNWLPPDNFQEKPQRRLAERTSPTNIGLYLLSSLAARDFGYVSAGTLLARTRNTFATLERLGRYRGHFYNWYDTRTCRPLNPLYVSTVDSGNLAACLIALKGGLTELVRQPVVPAQWRRGLADAAGVLLEEVDRTRARITDSRLLEDFQRIRRTVGAQLERVSHAGDSPADMREALSGLASALSGLEPAAQHDLEVEYWLAALRRQVDDLRDDLLFLLPWLAEGDGPGSTEKAAPAAAAAEAVPDELRKAMGRVMTLGDLAGLEQKVGAAVERAGLSGLRRCVTQASQRAAERIEALRDLAVRCGELADSDLTFLYDPARKLLSIGYSVSAHRRDPGYYDLLASEARLCSFLGVAQGKLPQEHWFLLGRALAPGDGTPSLVSWGGSMFEYLMPMLLMPNYEGTLLDAACRGAVQWQMRHARRHRVPWGFSESCYNQVDGEMNYLYRAFGVPELGLRRGLADDVVVAPYASLLALMVRPDHAFDNLELLARDGLMGRYGYYEAVDFTPERLPSNQNRAVVQSVMAHHLGMSLLSLDHALVGAPMQRRFLMDAEVRAALLLLQERIPEARPGTRQEHRLFPLGEREAEPQPGEVVRIFRDADLPVPAVHLLSNGRYHVMITSAGAGFARWRNIALTRWREDAARDGYGMFFYLHDVDSRRTWSVTPQPTGPALDRYEVAFSQARAEFRSLCHQIEGNVQVAVSPEDDIELRRITLTNTSPRPRRVELTSYAEVVLADARGEQAHPALNALFVQSEALPARSAVLCTRRARSADEKPPWMFHMMVVQGEQDVPTASVETDRERFLGRGRTAANPRAMRAPGALSNTAGPVLDPIVSIRQRVRLDPDGAVTVDVITGVSDSREGAMTLMDKYYDRHLPSRVFDMAWTHSQVLLHQLRASEADAQLFGRLAGSVVYANARYRANASLLARNRRRQSDLWRYGISGDHPVLLVRVTDRSGLDLARKAIQAHGYWRHKGLRVDLVIWADAFAGYRQSLLEEVMGLVTAGSEARALDQPGGIFVRSTDQLPEEDQLLLQSVARLVLSDRAGTMLEQADRRARLESEEPAFRPARRPEPLSPAESELPQRDLMFFNGLGGFTPDGREYVILLPPGTATPAPWSNVLANPRFGSIVTEAGGGYSWFENAQQFRLTPWYNDPVTDASGEAVYLRDEETGQYWALTPGGAERRAPYVCRHGLGYSAFEHTRHGISTEVYVYVGPEAPVKFVAVTVRNVSPRDRRLSVTGFCEWVLGETRDQNAMHVVTRLDPQTGALFAGNAYSTDFSDRVAFFQCSQTDRSYTADRTEFIGRNRLLNNPAGLERRCLSGRVGAGLDPCAAIQAYLTVPAGQERQVVFVLGAARNDPEARALLGRFSSTDGARQALEETWDFWKRLLGGVYAETPDASLNFLVNHWLLYQVLAGRFWGRTGYYQSGGAVGFRDQLQDSLAFLHECPWLTRQHLLTCAARQFRQGDVQHWWHPPTGRGVRTRCSDDYLWLPYAACHYVQATGDTGVLDEQVPFVDGRPLAPAEESYYDVPRSTDERASLYEHCIRAIRNGLRFGPHGLPLIGSCDWNDGLNRVGIKGQGESVWLAFFLHDVMSRFAELARSRQDGPVADLCLQAAGRLASAIEAHAWDGHWYRRAYFDDGTPLGSAENPECRIDSLPQSWAVLTGVGDPGYAEVAMQSVLRHLVDWDLRLVRLFAPPFDSSPWDPGYIKGYVPGVRENGGQYTHAAVWVVMALAQLHQAENAWRLLDILNPIGHGDTPERIARYKVEPYVLPGDVYTVAGNQGRGGWTWYTGSAGWMYRLLVERLLGLTLRGQTLHVAPLLPPSWNACRIHYRYRNTLYHIQITRAGPESWNVRRLLVDNAEQDERLIHLADDGGDHQVQVEVG